MNKLAIILLNWNGHEDTVECIESIRENEEQLFTIFLLDNGSKPESVDYIEEENSEVLKERSYDNCTIFFALSNIWGDSQRERLLQKISRSIKTGGSIYIWDINKEIGKLFYNKIRVILPSEKIKEFQFKNLNPMTSSGIEETRKILTEQFCIQEEKVWEDIYYIKARKK